MMLIGWPIPTYLTLELDIVSFSDVLFIFLGGAIISLSFLAIVKNLSIVLTLMLFLNYFGSVGCYKICIPCIPLLRFYEQVFLVNPINTFLQNTIFVEVNNYIMIYIPVIWGKMIIILLYNIIKLEGVHVALWEHNISTQNFGL